MKYLNEKSGKYSGMTMTGKAFYPRLVRPDTKYNKLGQYKADIRVPVEEAKELMSELSQVYKEWTGSAPSQNDNYMWKMDEDKKTGEPTGDVIFKLRVANRMNQEGELWNRRPKVFFRDADTRTDKIGGGSAIKVQFEVYCWNAEKKGVSLQPMSVLIEEVVEPQSEANPFGEGEEATFDDTANTPITEESDDADTTSKESNDFY
tara:strand:- start:5352 stop:5966 length:615 start_codon:yes stop_codon:yes gene_type:complete